jgi:hypothetical protein
MARATHFRRYHLHQGLFGELNIPPIPRRTVNEDIILTFVISAQSRLFLWTTALDKALEPTHDALDITTARPNDSAMVHLWDMERDLSGQLFECSIEAVDRTAVRAR